MSPRGAESSVLSLKRDTGLQSGVCGNTAVTAVHDPKVAEKTSIFLRQERLIRGGKRARRKKQSSSETTGGV